MNNRMFPIAIRTLRVRIVRVAPTDVGRLPEFDRRGITLRLRVTRTYAPVKLRSHRIRNKFCNSSTYYKDSTFFCKA